MNIITLEISGHIFFFFNYSINSFDDIIKQEKSSFFCFCLVNHMNFLLSCLFNSELISLTEIFMIKNVNLCVVVNYKFW